MDIRAVNNYFGDIDLYLLDALLKGLIPGSGKVLDVGCGTGRNALYFLQNDYEYHGWDRDKPAIQLLQHLASGIDTKHDPSFEVVDFNHQKPSKTYDLVLCSQVLHFAKSEEDFYNQWKTLAALTRQDGLLYVSMDSVVDTSIAEADKEGVALFPDGKKRFVLTSEIYHAIKENFTEMMPLKTMVSHGERAQSFFLFRKI